MRTRLVPNSAPRASVRIFSALGWDRTPHPFRIIAHLRAFVYFLGGDRSILLSYGTTALNSIWGKTFFVNNQPNGWNNSISCAHPQRKRDACIRRIQLPLEVGHGISFGVPNPIDILFLSLASTNNLIMPYSFPDVKTKMFFRC